MVKQSQTNNGFVDQTEFKTATKYLFDTLIFTNDVLDIIFLYLENIRPRLNPDCDFLLVSSNGTQFQSLTNAMTMLVHQAIGKYINPTRYRQIIETESSERLTTEEQRIISEDQKHSSQVAKIFYKKKHSRQVAIEGKKCMDKMTKDCRQQSSNLMDIFDSIENEFDVGVLEKSRGIIESETEQPSKTVNSASFQKDSKNIDPYQPIDDVLNDSTDMTVIRAFTSNTIKESNEPQFSGAQASTSGICDLTTRNIVNNHCKKALVKKTGKNVKFTVEEDEYLNDGIHKNGRKAWAVILKDKNYKFHQSRTRDSLRIRSDSAAFKKKFSIIIC